MTRIFHSAGNLPEMVRSIEARTHSRHNGKIQSFISEGDEGIDAGSAACGEPAGCERDSEKNSGGGGESGGVKRLDAEEQRGHEARGGRGPGDADGDAEHAHAQALEENEPGNIAALRAERHADADFVGALLDGLAEHAVSAYGGEKQREGGEGSD
jgi:hypothetical protein